jgi:hypothetical protein
MSAEFPICNEIHKFRPLQRFNRHCQALSSRNPLQTITVIQSDVNIKASSPGIGDEPVNILFACSAPDDLHNSPLKYFTKASNHPV